MSSQKQPDALRSDLEFKVPTNHLAEPAQGRRQANPPLPIPDAATTVKKHWDRRRFLIGGASAGIAGMAAAAVHDGELGGPAQTFRGSVPWREGTADAPPGASGSGYVFFAPAEAVFIEAAAGRLIPNDEAGP